MTIHQQSALYRIRRGKILGSPSEQDWQRVQPLQFTNTQATNRIGVMYVHGYTSTPHSMRALANAFMNEVYYTALPQIAGHGTTPEDMKSSTQEDWYQSIKDAYRQMQAHCETTVMVGQSMGALLLTRLAHEHPEINKLIFLAPAFYPPAILHFIPVLYPILKALGIHYLHSVGGNIKNKSGYEITYKKTAVSSHLELHRLCQQARQLLPLLQQPITVIGSRHDNVLSSHGVQRAYDSITSDNKHLFWLDNCYHVISLDNDAAKIIELVRDNIFNNR